MYPHCNYEIKVSVICGESENKVVVSFQCLGFRASTAEFPFQAGAFTPGDFYVYEREAANAAICREVAEYIHNRLMEPFYPKGHPK